jgi:hypothetical protein
MNHWNVCRLLYATGASLLLFVLAGCSGSTTQTGAHGGASGQSSSGGSSSGGSSSGGGSSGAPTTDSGGAGQSGTAGAGGSDCAFILGDFKTCAWQLLDKLDAAEGCTLGASGQCTDRIVDACGCQRAVNDANSPAVKCYFQTLAVRDCKVCDPTCPAVSGQCLAEDAGVARCR